MQILRKIKSHSIKYPSFMVLAVLLSFVFSFNLLTAPFIQQHIIAGHSSFSHIDCNDMSGNMVHSTPLPDSHQPSHQADCCRLMAHCAPCYPVNHEANYCYQLTPVKIVMILSNDDFLAKSDVLPLLPPPKFT